MAGRTCRVRVSTSWLGSRGKVRGRLGGRESREQVTANHGLAWPGLPGGGRGEGDVGGGRAGQEAQQPGTEGQVVRWSGGQVVRWSGS